MKRCIICEETFEGKRKHAQYCSKKCKKSAAYFRSKERRGRECSLCGEHFKAGSKDAQYCSQACINRATARPPVIKQCEQCSSEFEVVYVRRHRRFCSKSCSTQNSNANRDEDAVRKKISETKKRQFATGEVIHPFLGKKLTEEHKDRISKTRVDRGLAKCEKNPMFSKRGELSPNYGIKRSDETRELMSVRKTEQWIDGKYNGVDFKTRFKRGYHFSTKLNRDVHYRSSWEKIVYEELDADEGVMLYDAEPYKILYRAEYESNNRHYIPDILITYIDGTQKLVEIKPEYLVSAKKNQAKFKAAREFCESRNIIFEVWTEKTIEKMSQ